jgi:glycine/D-amino acid oxidase-like deaminating enzyme
MRSLIEHVVIVGGGTAGWLSACVLAARRPDLVVTLVEAPDIPTIGVGEGTWPTMRETLSTIGIEEAEFLRECDASFKQGSRFDGWVSGAPDDSYLHPFTPPPSGDMRELLAAWRAHDDTVAFAAAMTAQAAISDQNLAPRHPSMPDYAGTVNYGYHLDAGKFARLLTKHAITRLGVTHLTGKVTGVVAGDRDDIGAIELSDGALIAGDLFIDCTGQAALLIGGHFGVEWIDRSDVSFNDRALAMQVPTPPDSAIASQTIGTAHRAGWIWDIALPKRRGIGCVYAARFMSDEEADTVLREYVAAHIPGTDIAALSPRLLSFRTGYRSKFWTNNCIAIGLSAGFIEPLEASAIVLIELSLRALADNFPASRSAMDIHATRFNALFDYRWERIVDFLKLHYVLSRREEPYWRAQRDPATIPARLAEQLTLWRDQPPSTWDFPQVDEVFSAASQQYVLYGMRPQGLYQDASLATAQSTQLAEISKRARSLVAALPSNRTYFSALEAQAV